MDNETLVVLGIAAPVVMLLVAAPAALSGDSALRTLARLGLAVVVAGLVAAFVLVGNFGF